MKISFLNDSTVGYGADLTMRCYYNQAKKRGFEVGFNVIDESIEFYIIGMIYKGTEDKLKKHLKPMKYIYIEHSIELVLPEKEWIREWLIPNAYKLLFFSPRHRTHIQDALPSVQKHLVIDNYEYVVVPIDYNFFKRQDGFVRQKNLYIYVGLIHSNKGIIEILDIAKKNPENKYVFMGTTDNGDIGIETIKECDNVRYIGHQPPDVVRQYYSKAHGCYLLPTNGAVESAGRTVLEAMLCGCKPEVNNDVGNASYSWFWTYDRGVVIQKINESLDVFFKILSNGIKGV